MSYEYVAKVKKDADESKRVMQTLESYGIKPIAVRYKPETNSIVIYFDAELNQEGKEKLDKAMSKMGYMVMA